MTDPFEALAEWAEQEPSITGFGGKILTDCVAEAEQLRTRLKECRDVLWMTKLVREEGYTLATAKKIGCEANYSAFGVQALTRRVKIATDCAIANADRQLSEKRDSE